MYKQTWQHASQVSIVYTTYLPSSIHLRCLWCEAPILDNSVWVNSFTQKLFIHLWYTTKVTSTMIAFYIASALLMTLKDSMWEPIAGIDLIMQSQYLHFCFIGIRDATKHYPLGSFFILFSQNILLRRVVVLSGT